MLQPETDKFKLFPPPPYPPPLSPHCTVSLFEATTRDTACRALRRERRISSLANTVTALTFLKYNCWQFLFEMSQISGSINFSAYFSLIPFLRNKQTNKNLRSSLQPRRSPPLFCEFCTFFPLYEPCNLQYKISPWNFLLFHNLHSATWWCLQLSVLIYQWMRFYRSVFQGTISKLQGSVQQQIDWTYNLCHFLFEEETRSYSLCSVSPCSSELLPVPACPCT